MQEEDSQQHFWIFVNDAHGASAVNLYRLWNEIAIDYNLDVSKHVGVAIRGAGSGWAGGKLPQGGRLCLLKFVLQKYFQICSTLTYVISITIKSNDVCKIKKISVNYSTAMNVATKVLTYAVKA